MEDKNCNNKINEDRVIVESIFARKKQFLRLMEITFCCVSKTYSLFFKMCIDITNYPISLMPLRCKEVRFDDNYEHCWIDQAMQAEMEQKAKTEKAEIQSGLRKIYLPYVWRQW